MQRLCDTTNLRCDISPLHGGDTHRSYRVAADVPVLGHRRLFIKANQLSRHVVMESEFRSLSVLADTLGLAYPRPLVCESDQSNSYLVMAYHELTGLSDGQTPVSASEQLAVLLAQQHRLTAGYFGWQADNYIGLTPQGNSQCNDWLVFYREQRLQPQLALAASNTLPLELVDEIVKLSESIADLFQDYQPAPSLLHGDLWAGNVAFDQARAAPLLFDPAPYYGDREADIAMTELFGGFTASFYRAYQQAWPLHPGYFRRKPLYNLYHALNHFNLFGHAYSQLVAAQVAEIASGKKKKY